MIYVQLVHEKQDNSISRQQYKDIIRLRSLQITNKALGRTTEYIDKMSIALVPTQENNRQAGMPKNMVPGLEWFNGDRTKFKDWWRGIRLFLKSNRVMEINDRITAILAYLREGIAGIYTQKLNELDTETETQDQDKFVQEIKKTFSNKTKATDAEWKIETFKQGRKNITDFIIEFKALAMKVDTDKLHVIFLLKKNI